MRIGIRREDKNEWEKRVPIIPEHVKELYQKYDIEFVVQPSSIRAFSEEEYRQAGAIIQENLSECSIILAIKEIQGDFFIQNKVYVFFSHTIKGQQHNMPMLKRMMELKNTLIDYERIVDDKGKRLVFFGRFAGIAGMIDAFWAFGQRLEWEGYKTPFSKLKQALNYSNLDEVRSVYKGIGKVIKKEGLPKDIVPLIVGFTGYGNVSRGAQEMFDLFPHKKIEPKHLKDFMEKRNFSSHHLYKVVFEEEDMVRPIDSSISFGLQDYYHHPEKYASRFEDYLPYLKVLMNAIYWDKMYPKLVTKKYLKTIYEARKTLPLKVIGDISCDVEGSIECNLATTNSGAPLYVYDPLNQNIKYGIEGDGPVILAIDNLPCELPKESSSIFSSVLEHFIPRLVEIDFSAPFEKVNIHPEIKRATILYKGELTPDYKYLLKYLNRSK